MKFEHTPTEMAEKLMEFIRDFSDNDEEIKSEIDFVAHTFARLQQTDDLELNALVHHLDVMFMDSVFK